MRLLTGVLGDAREKLRGRGYLPGEKGCGKALQSILGEFYRTHHGAEPHRTPSGQFSTAEEHLAELAVQDPFFAELSVFRGAGKLLSTYLEKMGRDRVYPRFDFLLATGRTACSGVNLQNLPREADAADAAATIRGCFVPGPGGVFIDADYAQIELVAFAHACREQFGYGDTLARLINTGEDIHRLLAAAVLGKQSKEVTAAERKAVKAISFGRPGGMGPRRLQQVARAAYGIDLDEAAVAERIAAYHAICPELDRFLADEADAGRRVAEHLGLTPAACRGVPAIWANDPADHQPAGWLGGMLTKVLGDPAPVTRGGLGRPYSERELTYFWEAAQGLAAVLEPKLAKRLHRRTADPALAAAARDWAGRRPVFTATGRLRANATYCAARNTIFQGLSADGAILGLWKVWRAGYTVVDFVHDQVVVEVEAGASVPEHRRTVERLMIEGMNEVLPGMNVRVETAVTWSLDKRDQVDIGFAGSAEGKSSAGPKAA